MKTLKITLLILIYATLAQANVFVGKANSVKSVQSVSAGCSPAKNATTLELNNVRTRITTASDMWWDNTGSARYEWPKGSGKHVLFAASLWIAGVDAAGQLKVAAVRYRQDGNDFWPGPLNTATADIDAATCAEWDKHFKISKAEVEEFVAYQADKASFPNYTITPNITKWPGNGDAAKGQTNFLAPFYDVDGDGRYNPGAGDYPKYDMNASSTGGSCTDFLFGDETIWWVFNDKGNIHTESGAESIGVEIHAQAFAFATTNQINDMTFYSFKVFNRSSITLNDTYFGWCVDGDLGDPNDDYVGCDVRRGFGYFYNGDNADGNGNGNTYGPIPPAAGIDFFQGPLADPGDGKDNNRNGIIDEPNEQIIMSKFVYYSNNGTPYGDPQQANEYYNYLKGFWRNNTPMTYGGNGQATSGAPCNFMFPWDTDDEKGNVMWNENGPPKQLPADRRFVQSCGTFTLKPGAVNNVTVGAVVARATSGDELSSRALLLTADDLAQGLFDDCFKPIDGPDAPDVLARESLDKKIILLLTNKSTSNNYANSYDRWDRSISSFMNVKTVAGNRPILDSTFTFEGYQVFQLKTSSVSVTDLDNVDLARLIKVSDIKNGIGKIINYEFDINTNSYVGKVKVDGADIDLGLESSFEITTDAFNSGSPLVNHKPYYFMVVAYAYNNFMQYKSDVPYSSAYTASYEGQKLPFLRGRRNIKVVTAMPGIGSMINGNAAQATFGIQPQITRIEGQGNGGNNISLTKETVAEILKNGKAQNLVYEKGFAPIKVKVVDPLNIQDADFQFKLLPLTDDSLALDTGKTKWSLTNLATGDIVKSEGSILYQNEQIIEKWGISINAVQVAYPGTPKSISGGVLISSKTDNNWLRLISDNEVNWIMSDLVTNSNYSSLDPKFSFQSIVSGGVGPYRMCNTGKVKSSYPGFAWKDSLSATNRDSLYKMNSLLNQEDVQVVFTSDKAKWTRCPVLEMSDDTTLAIGKAKKMSLRKSPSVDKDGNSEAGQTGMGWFPGYAINRSTGERLNMAFGENSWLKTDNGADMKWNPTSRLTTPIFDSVGGGIHAIYVFGHNVSEPTRMPAYDEGKFMYEMLSKFDQNWDASTVSNLDASFKAELQKRAFYHKRLVYRDAMWVMFPILEEGGELLSSEVTLNIGIARPFRKMLAGSPFTSFTVTDSNAPGSSSPINNDYSLFTFSTKDLKPVLDNEQLKKDALNLISAVPNPYYAYSAYEKDITYNTIRITNLPVKCDITIYTNNGIIVRKLSKDSPQSSIDWDLKNTVNIPVASGLYLIHVNVPGVGERTLKWMGVMRQLDLETF